MAIILSAQDDSALPRALEELGAGRPVAIPTETVYGLAADATNGEAVARIFALKGRPSFNPLICHVDGMEMAQAHGELSEAALALARRFWPGPLTIVVPRRATSTIHDLAAAGLGTVGLRCPAGFAGQLITALGRPLAAPSANRSGRISPTTAQHVAEEYPDEPLLVIDGGASPVGIELTIVKIEGERIILLRPGFVTAGEIGAATGSPVEMVAEGAGIEAPGMMKSHYAPDALLRLDCRNCEPGAAWLGFGPDGGRDAGASISRNLSTSGDLVEAAANLYAMMKELDASGVNVICAAPVTGSGRDGGLAIAINDRLKRAAAPRDGQEEQA